MSQNDWPTTWTAIIGATVKARRKELGWTARELSERCAEVGHKIPRSVIANLENGRREGIPVHQLAVLARALVTSPVELLFPVDQVETVPMFLHRDWPVFMGAEWFSGRVEDLDRPQPLTLWRRHFRAMDVFHSYDRLHPSNARLSDEERERRRESAASEVLRLREQMELEKIPLPPAEDDGGDLRAVELAKSVRERVQQEMHDAQG